MPMLLQSEVKELLEASAELCVTLQAWGFDHNPILMARDPDTGKVLDPSKSPLGRLRNAILVMRSIENTANSLSGVDREDV